MFYIRPNTALMFQKQRGCKLIYVVFVLRKFSVQLDPYMMGNFRFGNPNLSTSCTNANRPRL